MLCSVVFSCHLLHKDIKYPLKFLSINFVNNFTVLKLPSIYSAESTRTFKKCNKR